MLNGGKTFTTNAHYADVCVAMAVTDRAASQHGISAFIIEKGHAGFPRRQEREQARDAGERDRRGDFQDCRVPATQLLGKQGEGFVDSLRILDGGRISIAALSVGMAQGAYDAALQVLEAAEAVRPSDLASFRRSSTSSRTWRRRSMRRGC